MKKDTIKKIVKNKYKEIATRGSSCGCGRNSAKTISKSIGYSEEELKIVGEANLGLGCGNPLAFGKIKEGDIVLDLGSGAGIDAILAAKKVGVNGKVIGVDMTEEMVEKVKENAKKQNINNVEFLLGEIEKGGKLCKKYESVGASFYKWAKDSKKVLIKLTKYSWIAIKESNMDEEPSMEMLSKKYEVWAINLNTFILEKVINEQ